MQDAMQLKCGTARGARAGAGARVAVVAAVVLASATALATGPDTGARWSKDPASGCQFVAPVSLPGDATSWIGACTAGKASGLGMLRARVDGQAGPAFYGELRDGVPVNGVVDARVGDEGGYRAGRFVDGDIGAAPAAGQAWQDGHDGFEVAVRAARAVSEHYAGADNAASARHYRAVADALDSQLGRD